MVFKLPHLKLWHMLPIAIGLHGLLFAVPIPSVEEKAEAPKSDSVNVVNLPKPSPTVASPTPKPSPKVQPSSPPRPIKPAILPTPQQAIQPQPQVAPLSQPSVSPSPSISPSPSPSISPSPTDALQITGASPGCNGRLGCWQMTESNGRIVGTTLEQQLQQKGYTVTKQDLAQDTGFSVYEVAKDGVKQYYLHMIWSDRGTTYIRNNAQLSYSQITTLAGL